MRPSVLVVQNASWEGPGLIELYARAAGVSLRTVALCDGAVLPFEGVEGGAYSAVVALGSPSTAYLPKTDAHRKDLVRLFEMVRRLEIPSFNVCYSMQLFSLVHGGRVAKNPKGKEVGFAEVRPTSQAKSDPVFGPVGRYTTLQWHGDIVEVLPSGSTLLASSKKTKNQIAVLDGIHYLVQSDGQAATRTMIKSWLKHDSEWATKGTGLRPTELLREAAAHEAYFRNTFLRFFGNFLDLAIKP